VQYSGSHSGNVHYSATITNYFATTWESTPADAAHNGPKAGYKWWAGYGNTHDMLETDVVTVTIRIDTHAKHGNFLLDFVSGITDPANPEDLAANGNGSNWEFGGMVTDQKGVRLNQPATLLQSQPTFLDVPTGYPYFDAIEGMSAAGIINGYDVPGGKQFRPDNPVWRWQFAKMICGSLGLTVNEALIANFNDLGADSPATLEPHDYVAAAANAGIIFGYTDGSFRAYTNIKHAHVITMIVRGMKSEHPGILQSPPVGYVGTLGNFSPDHADNMRWAEFNGLLTGLQGFGPSWDPWADMKRGEVAQALWNTMALLPS
jgi:hypothetical protein